MRSADERLMRLKRVSWRDDGPIDSARLVASARLRIADSP